MNLTKKNLALIQAAGTDIPDQGIFMLPEKILQFGTGVLLRALPDYFVDRANRQGIFNGRILVVKTTGAGDADAFSRQDGMYTISIRGKENGVSTDERIICSAISRVLSAGHQWKDLMHAASSPHLKIIISNTTEVGIQLVEESIFQEPPASFPAKLLAFLFERYKAMNGAASAGMIIIPTELLSDNGNKLESIVKTLAVLNNLGSSFMEWLEQCNHFCSSLVDRIVPGKPEQAVKNQLEQQWGYEDELMSVCEPYCLWAIEGDESVREIVSFSAVDESLVIAPDITKYRELKLRMLNATHTLCCGLAYISGFDTVKKAMDDPFFESFIGKLMMDEIGQAIPFPIPSEEIHAFGLKVLDRFRNPFLQHPWLNISMQYSSKMAMRVVPVLKHYYTLYKKPPERIAIGFAAFLLFMRPVKKNLDTYYGIFDNKQYLIQDDRAAYFYSLWQKVSLEEIAYVLLANTELWQSDLGLLPGFGDAVTAHLKNLVSSTPQQYLSGIK